MTHSQMSRLLMKRGGKEGLRIRDCYQQRPRKRARPELQGTNPGKDNRASHGKKGITSYPLVRILRFPSKSLTEVARLIETSSNIISLKTILETPKNSIMCNNCPDGSATEGEVGWMQSDISECKEKTGKLEQSLEETVKKLPRSMGYLQQEMGAVEIVQNISLRSQGE